MDEIEQLVENITYKTRLITREEILSSTIEKTRIKGLIIGIIIVFIFIAIPLILLK